MFLFLQFTFRFSAQIPHFSNVCISCGKRADLLAWHKYLTLETCAQVVKERAATGKGNNLPKFERDVFLSGCERCVDGFNWPQV